MLSEPFDVFDAGRMGVFADPEGFAVLADPAGASFTASQFVAENR